MRSIARAFILATALVAGPSLAEPVGGDAIADLVAGRKVFLSTPYGLEFPLRYGADGTVTGDATGFVLARLLAPRETGRWWVESGQLCQKWPSWYDGKTFCFAIRRTGQGRIAWMRNDGLEGVARIE